MNPGLVPRELSGTQLLSEDMGTGWRGVKFEVPKAFYQVCLALLFLAYDFSGLGYHVYKMGTTNHS